MYSHSVPREWFFFSTVRAVQYFHRAVKLYEWKIISIFYGSINYTQGADRILV